jgi:hypothetical protein
LLSDETPNSIESCMGRCSSCGLDLPEDEQLCSECYRAQYAALTAAKGSSSYSWSAYIYLPLWIFVSYAFLTYMPAFAKAGILLAGLLVIWYLHFWSLSKRPRKRYGTPPDQLSFILAVCCGVVWKITGSDASGRLGIACIFVSGGYRAVYRAIDRVKTARRSTVPTTGSTEM